VPCGETLVSKDVGFGPCVALVIGNDRYAEAPLRNAVNDAVAMARAPCARRVSK